MTRSFRKGLWCFRYIYSCAWINVIITTQTLQTTLHAPFLSSQTKSYATWGWTSWRRAVLVLVGHAGDSRRTYVQKNYIQCLPWWILYFKAGFAVATLYHGRQTDKLSGGLSILPYLPRTRKPFLGISLCHHGRCCWRVRSYIASIGAYIYFCWVYGRWHC